MGNEWLIKTCEVVFVVHYSGTELGNRTYRDGLHELYLVDEGKYD